MDTVSSEGPMYTHVYVFVGTEFWCLMFSNYHIDFVGPKFGFYGFMAYGQRVPSQALGIPVSGNINFTLDTLTQILFHAVDVPPKLEQSNATSPNIALQMPSGALLLQMYSVNAFPGPLICSHWSEACKYVPSFS